MHVILPSFPVPTNQPSVPTDGRTIAESCLSKAVKWYCPVATYAHTDIDTHTSKSIIHRAKRT